MESPLRLHAASLLTTPPSSARSVRASRVHITASDIWSPYGGAADDSTLANYRCVAGRLVSTFRTALLPSSTKVQKYKTDRLTLEHACTTRQGHSSSSRWCILQVTARSINWIQTAVRLVTTQFRSPLHFNPCSSVCLLCLSRTPPQLGAAPVLLLHLKYD